MEQKTSIANIEFDKESLSIKSDRSLYCETFYFTDVFDDKRFVAFIKGSEKQFRNSEYYNEYIKRLRSSVEVLNRDALQSNITSMDASLEFHHYPLSLYEISEILICKALKEKRNITTFSIAKELAEIHFKHNVGLVSLTKQNHKLQHDSLIFINSNQVFGNYKEFINEHEDYLTNEMKEKINSINEMTDKDISFDIKGIL